MSDLVERLFTRLREIVPEVLEEGKRMGGLGASELAAALFKGDPFVMYGPSQRAPKVEQEHSMSEGYERATEPEHGQQHEAERQMGREL
jgi:hypothetical protein